MPNNNNKGRALARLAINTVTSSRAGNILFPKRKMSRELKQAAYKRPAILDASKLNEKERKKYADSSLQALRKRHFAKAIENPRLDKTNFKQEAPRLYNKKNPLNYHIGGQSGKRGRRKGYAKLDTSKMADFKGGVAPIGGGAGLGRFAGAFANTAKQYLKKSGVFGKNVLSAAKQLKKVGAKKKPKYPREKVTGLSDDFFKSVEKDLKRRAKKGEVKFTSSGYYVKK